jgi:hypothetical protein
MSKKMMSMPLALLCTCLAFFGLNELGPFLCTTHTFFSECLSTHCQGLHRSFSEICTKFDAVPPFDPQQNHIRLHTWLKIKGRKKISLSSQLYDILYTDSQDMLILSSTIALRYYNCCTDGSTSHGNYGYPLYIISTKSSTALNQYTPPTCAPTSSYFINKVID